MSVTRVRIPQRRQRRGMTLMELIVGLLITGLMATLGTAALGTIIDHRNIINSSTIDMERAAALRETLRMWLASGTVAIQTGGVPRGGGTRSISSSAMSSSTSTISAAASTGDEITFTTSAPNPAMAPSVRIRLFVDGDAGTPESGLTIEYQTSNATPLQRRQLEASIGGMTVEFLDNRTHRWLPASEAATITPRAVRVSLLPFDGAQIPAILQLPLIFPMGTQ